MIIASVVCLFSLGILSSVSLIYFSYKIMKAKEVDAERMLYMYTYAMDSIKAASLTEKVDTEQTRKAQDVAIIQLTEAYEQELKKIKHEQQKKLVDEETVETVDGKRIPLSRLEMIRPEDLL